MPQERQIAGRPPLIESRRAVEVLQRQLVERDAKRWASVPAASTMVLPYLAEVVTVTGSATIAAITPDQGREVTLIFAATSTVQNSASVKLAGAVSYVAGAGNTLTLACDNGVWREAGRNDGTVGGSGAPGPPGPAGPTGATGAAGADGADGADGVMSVFEQDAQPTPDPEVGSIWLDTDAAPPAPIERAVTYNTTFPTTPATGDMHFYPNGTAIWQYVWDEWDAVWYFVGGPPLVAEVATAETKAAGSTYGALTTPGPAITLPLAGDYIVAIGAQTSGQGHTKDAYMSYSIGGTGAVDADAVKATGTDAYWPTWAGSRERHKSGLGAVALVAQYRGETGAAAEFADRWMRVTPVKHTP